MVAVTGVVEILVEGPLGHCIKPKPRLSHNQLIVARLLNDGLHPMPDSRLTQSPSTLCDKYKFPLYIP